jgi:hypothetical protein
LRISIQSILLRILCARVESFEDGVEIGWSPAWSVSTNTQRLKMARTYAGTYRDVLCAAVLRGLSDLRRQLSWLVKPVTIIKGDPFITKSKILPV